LVESSENATIASAADPGACPDQSFESEDRSVIRTTISAKLVKPVDRQAIEVVTGLQPCLDYKLRDVVERVAAHESPLDEAEAIDRRGQKDKVVRTTGSSSRGLKKATVPVEPHLVYSHADGLSQSGESERLRSHLHILNAYTLPEPGCAILDWGNGRCNDSKVVGRAILTRPMVPVRRGQRD
jgi:hypothetical protein